MTIVFKETQGYTTGDVVNTFYGINGVIAYEVKTFDDVLLIIKISDVEL